MKSMLSEVRGVAASQEYILDGMDRREYIRSQVASYPEYADRIADEMYEPRNRARYPIFERAKVHTGFEVDADGKQWPTFRAGELRFVGWMDGREHAEYLERRQREREEAISDG